VFNFDEKWVWLHFPQTHQVTLVATMLNSFLYLSINVTALVSICNNRLDLLHSKTKSFNLKKQKKIQMNVIKFKCRLTYQGFRTIAKL
jgi:hypothetical protein